MPRKILHIAQRSIVSTLKDGATKVPSLCSQKCLVGSLCFWDCHAPAVARITTQLWTVVRSAAAKNGFRRRAFESIMRDPALPDSKLLRFLVKMRLVQILNPVLFGQWAGIPVCPRQR